MYLFKHLKYLTVAHTIRKQWQEEGILSYRARYNHKNKQHNRTLLLTQMKHKSN